VALTPEEFAVFEALRIKHGVEVVELAQESGLVETQVCESSPADFVVESSGGTGEGLMRIIAPGQGSSMFYSKEVLRRDGPSIFKKGLQMFWNHATEGEDETRPEGDLNRQAAVLTSDAYWDDKGPVGEGVYAKYKAFSDYKDRIAERVQHGAVAVSWKGWASSTMGQVAGKATKIAQKLLRAESVDFVTLAGAGGAIARASEAANSRQIQGGVGMAEVPDNELLSLRESANEAQTLKAKLAKMLVTARESAAKVVITAKTSKLNQKQREALEPLLLKNLPETADGELDTKAFEAQVDAAVAPFIVAETQESAGGNGAIDMGGSGQAPVLEGEKLFKESVRNYERMGLTKEAAERAARAAGLGVN
jgi:hypothetical protein